MSDYLDLEEEISDLEKQVDKLAGQKNRLATALRTIVEWAEVGELPVKAVVNLADNALKTDAPLTTLLIRNLTTENEALRTQLAAAQAERDALKMALEPILRLKWALYGPKSADQIAMLVCQMPRILNADGTIKRETYEITITAGEVKAMLRALAALTKGD